MKNDSLTWGIISIASNSLSVFLELYSSLHSLCSLYSKKTDKLLDAIEIIPHIKESFFIFFNLFEDLLARSFYWPKGGKMKRSWNDWILSKFIRECIWWKKTPKMDNENINKSKNKNKNKNKNKHENKNKIESNSKNKKKKHNKNRIMNFLQSWEDNLK